MYRERPSDEPMTAAEIMAVWWKNRGDGVIAWIVIGVVLFSTSLVVRACMSKSREDAAYERSERNAMTRGECRDYGFASNGDSVSCPRPDQRLTWSGSWIICTCTGKK
jgi:hypothetical protein